MFVLGNGIDDGGRAVVLPVKTVDIPLDGIVADGADIGNDIIVIIPVWRAEKEHFIAGEFLYFLMDG